MPCVCTVRLCVRMHRNNLGDREGWGDANNHRRSGRARQRRARGRVRATTDCSARLHHKTVPKEDCTKWLRSVIQLQCRGTATELALRKNRIVHNIKRHRVQNTHTCITTFMLTCIFFMLTTLHVSNSSLVTAKVTSINKRFAKADILLVGTDPTKNTFRGMIRIQVSARSAWCS